MRKALTQQPIRGLIYQTSVKYGFIDLLCPRALEIAHNKGVRYTSAALRYVQSQQTGFAEHLSKPLTAVKPQCVTQQMAYQQAQSAGFQKVGFNVQQEQRVSTRSSQGGDTARIIQQLQRYNRIQKNKLVKSQDGHELLDVRDLNVKEQLQAIMSRPALIVARPIEWGQIILGYEACQRYTIYDETGIVVGHIAEDSGGFGTMVGRQLLRTRRSFTSTIMSPTGQVLLRLRRPWYLINSTVYLEDDTGAKIGEVRQSWHPLWRNYDLYLGQKQFGRINGNFLAWEFMINDAKGAPMALIDRNFSGFGKELFTDAGQYVIHFGQAPQQAAARATAIRSSQYTQITPPVTTVARLRTNAPVIATSTGSQLVVKRPLNLPQRLVALACAVSVDYNYFSRHSNRSGWLPMFMPMPLPLPSEGSPEDGGAAGLGAAGADAGTDGGAGVDAGGGEFGGGDMGVEGGGEWGGQEWDAGVDWGDSGGDGGFGVDDSAGWSWDDSAGGDAEGGGMFGALGDFLSGLSGDN